MVLIRETLRGTPLWDNCTFYDSDFLGPGPLVRDLVTARECEHDATMRRYWRRLSLTEADCETRLSHFVSWEEAPRHIRLDTKDRLAFLTHMQRLARKLDGWPVRLEVECSWTTNPSDLTPTGEPRYRTRYVLGIGMNASKPFKASAWLPTAFDWVCRSTDVRADWSVFQLESRERKNKPRYCTSYAPTQDGFKLEFETLKQAQVAVDAMFPDCETEFPPKAKNELQVVFITFPDCVHKKAA